MGTTHSTFFTPVCRGASKRAASVLARASPYAAYSAKQPVMLACYRLETVPLWCRRRFAYERFSRAEQAFCTLRSPRASAYRDVCSRAALDFVYHGRRLMFALTGVERYMGAIKCVEEAVVAVRGEYRGQPGGEMRSGRYIAGRFYGHGRCHNFSSPTSHSRLPLHFFSHIIATTPYSCALVDES